MKCIIIDDEPIARKGMKRLVDAHPDLELAEMFESAVKASKWLQEHTADLIFLDIEMPGINGIEFARQLPKSSLVVFTTAYSDYALDSYEVEAIDYLVKPIRRERFEKAVERAATYRSLLAAAAEVAPAPDLEFIIVKSERKYVRVKLDDILYVEGLKDYVIIHLPDRRAVTRMIVKAMEDMLPAERFLRISKSYIVNKSKIDAFDTKDVTIGTTELAIGASYRDAVLASLLH